jgi:phage/plasmid-associated DNA primase
MTTTYAYVSPDDARVPRVCAEIMEYYATLFAADAADPNDELVRKARLMVGSYLYPCNYAKKLHVYLGHEGNNGKSAFAEFLRLTLGDYYVTGNLSALTPGPRETLDVEIIRNYKALICSYPEAQSSDRVSGHSTGLKLDSAKLKVMTGNDTVCARGLYQMPRNIGIKHKPIMMSNTMPELDHDDEAASGRVRVSLFGSRFVKTSAAQVEDRARRIYGRTPNLNARLEEWAPFHMLLMLEWLRAFKACEMELPPGDEHTVGSYANRAVALQTPEGKLREWVEDHYVHVPLREKDTGTKLEALYAAYTACMPPVHAKVLGRNTFGKMLSAVWPNIGPHKNGACTVSGLYLIR